MQMNSIHSVDWHQHSISVIKLFLHISRSILFYNLIFIFLKIIVKYFPGVESDLCSSVERCEQADDQNTTVETRLSLGPGLSIYHNTTPQQLIQTFVSTTPTPVESVRLNISELLLLISRPDQTLVLSTTSLNSTGSVSLSVPASAQSPDIRPSLTGHSKHLLSSVHRQPNWPDPGSILALWWPVWCP